MKHEIQKLRNDVEMKKESFTEAKRRLDTIVTSCHHKFGETVYDPIVTAGYHISGDPPGTMGVDRQLPMDVPEHVEKRWKRICDICGEIDYTTQTKQEVKHLPIWPEKRKYSHYNFPEEGGYSKLDI